MQNDDLFVCPHCEVIQWSCMFVWSGCDLWILQHLFCQELPFNSYKKHFWCVIVVGLSEWFSRTFLTKYRVRAMSQQKRGCVSGNVGTFSVFGNKLLVGKTIRLKTWADIQHVKNVMPTLPKRFMGHSLENCGTL